MTSYYLFSTSGCHLCELAEEQILPLVQSGSDTVSIEWVDIMDNDDWVDKYATRIPVLSSKDESHCLNWPFNTKDVESFFEMTSYK